MKYIRGEFHFGPISLRTYTRSAGEYKRAAHLEARERKKSELCLEEVDFALCIIPLSFRRDISSGLRHVIYSSPRLMRVRE